jgi:hypothetical protein
MVRNRERGSGGRGAVAAGAGLLAGPALLLLALAGVAPAPAASPEPLPADDPVAFLQKCLERIDGRRFGGYSLHMHKQERIDGKLEPGEDVEVLVRTRPYSVFMRWLRGACGADRALYVEGANDGKILVHPVGLVGRLVGDVALAPDSRKVRESSRYSIKEVGLRETLVRTLDAWRAGAGKPAAQRPVQLRHDAGGDVRGVLAARPARLRGHRLEGGDLPVHDPDRRRRGL